MLNTNKTLRRAVSVGAMACGIVLIILCLVLAFTGSTLSFRGPLLVIGSVAFFLALLCTSKIRGVGFFRAAFFLPNLIGGIVLGYIWQFIFNKVFLTLFNTNFSILADANGAFLAIIVVYVWQYAGYIMMIYITGLQQVPRDVIEASAIDGASPFRTLFAIKIPMIASTFTICTFLTLTSAFKQFDVNLSLTGGTPARMMGSTIYSNGTEMLALNIYKTAVSKSDYVCNQTAPMKTLYWDMICTVMRSTARLCIIPMQDYPGLGNEARINRPSTLGSNWRWRLLPGEFTPGLCARIARITACYGRI